jgi:hypothetical protein
MNTKIASTGVAWLLVAASAQAAEVTPNAPSDPTTPPVAVQSRETSPAPSETPPPPPSIAPCADPDATGPFLSSSGCSGVFGLRGSAATVRGVAATEGSGLMVSAEGEEFVRRGVFSTHGMHRLAIGGGGAGFEGTLQGGLAGGFRLPVGERHGPVVRAGIFGYLRGNDAFYASLIDLPQVQLGYQYLHGRTVIELGATSGAVLTGRFRAGEAETRILGAGLEVGGYAALQIPWFRLGLSAMRLPTNDALSSPVRTAEGTLCAIATPFAICADARATQADAIAFSGAAPVEVTSVYAGLAFGLTRER